MPDALEFAPGHESEMATRAWMFMDSEHFQEWARGDRSDVAHPDHERVRFPQEVLSDIRKGLDEFFDPLAGEYSPNTVTDAIIALGARASVEEVVKVREVAYGPLVGKPAV